MKQALALPFPLLSDPDGTVISAYGLVHRGAKPFSPDAEKYARPAELLLDGAGVIRWAAFTDNFRVRIRPEAILSAAAQLEK